jgi:hypothetical protein
MNRYKQISSELEYTVEVGVINNLHNLWEKHKIREKGIHLMVNPVTDDEKKFFIFGEDCDENDIPLEVRKELVKCTEDGYIEFGVAILYLDDNGHQVPRPSSCDGFRFRIGEHGYITNNYIRM